MRNTIPEGLTGSRERADETRNASGNSVRKAASQERDESGGRKRKLPVEVSSNYTSKRSGEPPVDQEWLKKLRDDLARPKCPKIVSQVLKLKLDKEKESASIGVSGTPVEVTAEKENMLPSAQRSSTWFSERVGKITSSKAPAVIVYKEEKNSKNLRNVFGTLTDE